jgi:RNA polymerase sigma factor (sigma-70 family)
MSSRTQIRENLFRSFRAGKASLRDLLELERPELYDWLLRMTADQTRALDGVDEVLNSVESSEEDFADLENLRACLYRTARNFHADAWRAPTSLLANALIEGESSQDLTKDSNKDGKGIDPERRDDFATLDKFVRQLPPDEREVLLLVRRYDFSKQAAADVLAIEEEMVKEHLRGVEEDLRMLGAGLDKLMGELPLHPMPAPAHQTSTNLSEIIHDLREARGFRHWPWKRIAFVAVILAAAVWAYLQL